MTGAALHDDVTSAEVVLAVIEAQHDLAIDDRDDVQRVGGVHPRLRRVVTGHPHPFVVRPGRGGREAYDPDGQPSGRRLERETSLGAVAAVIDPDGGTVEPQQLGDRDTRQSLSRERPAI